MKRFDEVVLKNEVEELSEKNIHLGCAGDVIGVDGTKCKVIFYSPRIYGDFAIVTVDESALEYKKQIDNCFVKSFEDFLKIVNESAHTRLLDDDVHEYDEIEMLVEKEKYVRHGVHKGMTGVVMEDTSYYNQWYVIFTATDGSGEDIADINVYRDDFKIIHKSSVHRDNK